MRTMNIPRRFLLAMALVAMPPAIAYAQAKPVPVQGEVMRVNSAEGKVTLRHSPIPNLEMDSMSGMVFPLADPSQLSGLKPGDKVVFEADRVNGRVTITRINKVRQ